MYRNTFLARAETYLTLLSLKGDRTEKHLNPLQHKSCAKIRRRQQACMLRRFEVNGK